MTKDQKTVLSTLGVFVGFKAVLFGTIIYSTMYYRKMMNQYKLI